MTIEYDAGTLTGWCGLPRLLLRWQGTILHGALLGPMFWLVNLSHIAYLILGGRIEIRVPHGGMFGGGNSTGAGAGTGSEVEWRVWTPLSLPVLPWSTAVVGLTLLFFFIVFYGNASYGRFYQLYGHCVGIGGTTMEWVALVKQHSAGMREPERSSAQWNAVRFVLAAGHLLYYALHGDGLSDDEWQMIVLRDLLTEGEVEALKAYKGMKPFLAICWGLDHAKLMFARAHHPHLQHNSAASVHAEELMMAPMREVAFKMRGHMGQIINLLKQPVPFPYFHLLNCILLVQLLLISYALAGVGSGTGALAPYFSIGIMAFITIVLLGMRGLAVQLSNPFGNDAVDFEIEKFLKGSYTNAVAHLREAEVRVDVGSMPTSRMRNPVGPTISAELQKSLDVAWAKVPSQVGTIKDDDRVIPAEFVDGMSSLAQFGSKQLGSSLFGSASGADAAAAKSTTPRMPAAGAHPNSVFIPHETPAARAMPAPPMSIPTKPTALPPPTGATQRTPAYHHNAYADTPIAGLASTNRALNRALRAKTGPQQTAVSGGRPADTSYVL